MTFFGESNGFSLQDIYFLTKKSPRNFTILHIEIMNGLKLKPPRIKTCTNLRTYGLQTPGEEICLPCTAENQLQIPNF